MKVAIIVKNHTHQLKDVGDINGYALHKELEKLKIDSEIIYLHKSKQATPKNAYSVRQAFTRNYTHIYASSPQRLFGPLCILFAFAHLKPLYISIFGSTLAPITENAIGKSTFSILLKLKLVKPFAVSLHQQKYYHKKFSVKPPVLLPCLFNFGYNKNFKKTKNPRILFVGSNDNMARGIVTVLESTKNLVKKYPKLELRILNKFSKKIRKPEETEKLIKKWGLSKNVKIIGFVKSMNDEYRKAWMCVLPFSETRYTPPIPFSFIESMSSSVPAISTKSEQLKEILPKKYMVESDNEKELTKIINRVIAKKETTAISKKYFPSEVASRFLKLL